MTAALQCWHSTGMHANDPYRLREAAEIASRFGIVTDPDGIASLGNGLVNHTFLIAAGGQRWVLQRLNAKVFPYPRRILENLERLSSHLADKPNRGPRIPALLRGQNGAGWVKGGDGALWRLLEFIEDGQPLGRIDNLHQAAEVGRALGGFHRAVADLPLQTLAVALPGFHVTPDYIARFMEVISACGADRTDEIQAAIAFVADRERDAGVLEQARRTGSIPQRVIHGDPKLGNILFDHAGRQALALIDLDTVQPGLVHYDIGDCLRSCCNRGGESADGREGPSFDLDLCRSLLGAYSEYLGTLLLAREVDLIFDAIRLIPFELGIRFLTDHLEGDRLFRVSEPGDNLAKARIQFALTADIERKESAIRAIVGACDWQIAPSRRRTAVPGAIR